MRVLTTTTASPEPQYGALSPALLARADRGYAQFLAQQTDHPDDSDGQDRRTAPPTPATTRQRGPR
ncbi:hypothetical protein AB0D94_22330 [Streptomyces sp. NPDC048255]|uniref:hypothetical protein n=1 Tax=Streptomyces sp. NPDC048255 TaxID=3154713 RepID=UPI0033FE8F39